MKFIIDIKMLFVNFFYWVGVWLSRRNPKNEGIELNRRVRSIQKVMKIIDSCETLPNYDITKNIYNQLSLNWPDMELSKWGTKTNEQ